MSKKNPHWGESLDDFLREEGTRAQAVTRAEAWKLCHAMKRNGISRTLRSNCDSRQLMIGRPLQNGGPEIC
jgi:hypothetical protein